MNQRMLRLLSVLCLQALGIAGAAGAGETAPGGPASAPDDFRVSLVEYRVPDVRLVRQDGKAVSLAAELDDGRPVALNFIFTSCEAVCPLMTQTFAEFQRKLGPESSRVHLMSISIDPEQDTPARLREYARRFKAGPGWTYYTGTEAASLAAQKAFGVYRGDKMSHTSVTLFRSAPGASWRRVEGFATPDDLVREYNVLVAHEAAPAHANLN
jgi:protein SCO1